MRLAIFSDIHGNWEALQTAVEYTKGRKVAKYAVLGDTLGYGANPNECFEWVLANASIHIAGNHEKAVLDLSLREWFHDVACIAIEWTAGVLSPALKKKIDEIPYLRIEEGITFTHGSPDRPEEFRYLMNFEDARTSFRSMENSVCFVGHTHVPACFSESRERVDYLLPGTIELREGGRYILNPGSVGQPRDRDKRLALGIFDGEKKTFEIVRLEYDSKTAAAKIRRAGLPASLADRLL